MALFSKARIILFSFAIVCSLIELGINAYFLSLTAPSYFIFSALGTATALLTIITVPVMLIVDFVRRGAFTSMIVVELGWLFILWVLWVATAGEAAYTSNSYFPAGCDYATIDPAVNVYCMELQAVEAFAFLNFIILFSYTIVLLVFSIIASSRGKNVWTSSVKESTSFVPQSGHVHHQVPLSQYSGTPSTGYNVAQPHSEYNVAQPQGTYNYSNVPAQSPQMQPQQLSQAGYVGAPSPQQV